MVATAPVLSADILLLELNDSSPMMARVRCQTSSWLGFLMGVTPLRLDLLLGSAGMLSSSSSSSSSSSGGRKSQRSVEAEAGCTGVVRGLDGRGSFIARAPA